MHADKIATAFFLVLLGAPLVQGAEVVAQRPDNLSGQMIGGWSAVLLGGVLGGPAGALAGGVAGAWLGGELQQATGNSGNAYLIKTDAGEIKRYRSPRHTFEIGDTVAIEGIRPVPVPRCPSVLEEKSD